MATKIEKDSVTGTETTGHEWDGIKELNTPLPKWWLYVMYATIAWSLVYFLLYPAIPGITGYTKGLIGGSAREALVGKLEQAKARQAGFVDRIVAAEPDAIAADPELLSFSVAGGRAAFADNCAPCHGLGGAGRPGGFPSLADDAWIWGGDLAAIQHTILYGVRQDLIDESRFSEMPAFGADEILSAEELGDLAEHLLAYSGRSEDSEAAARGAELYIDNCAACHGDEGEGLVELGAPRLNDSIWLYGGERDAIVAQIHKPKQGVMPAWQDRLDDATIKMLTVYVHSLGGGQ